MDPITAPLVEALAPANPPSAEALADAMVSEKRLVDELIRILRRQRHAVSADDRDGIDDTLFATHRVLDTLGEARRRRHSLNRMLGERESLPIEALDDVLGARMTDSLRSVRRSLQCSATALSCAVTANRMLLRQKYSA